MRRASWLGLFFAVAVASPACRTSLDTDPDAGKFHCGSDSDCGDGWHCFSSCKAAGFSAYCSQNGGCDACPSLSDDPHNCGSCGKVCGATEGCIDGTCVSALAPDGGAVDGGEDAGPDGGSDAGIDGGDVAGIADAGADAGSDAGEDAGLHDGGLPDGSVSGVDAGETDAGSDAGLADAGDGGGGDAGSDAGIADGGPDSGV